MWSVGGSQMKQAWPGAVNHWSWQWVPGITMLFSLCHVCLKYNKWFKSHFIYTVSRQGAAEQFLVLLLKIKMVNEVSELDLTHGL